MKELWGIDDPLIARSIERMCYERSASVKSVLWTALWIGVMTGAVSAGVVLALGIRGWRLYGAQVAVVALGCVAAVWWRRVRVARVLPEILRSIGRCTNCGYKFDTNSDRGCPECGRPAPDTQISTKESTE